MKRHLARIAILSTALLGLATASAEAAAPVSAGLAAKTTEAGRSAIEQVAYRCWRSGGHRVCRWYPSYAYRYYDSGPSYYYGSPYRYRYYRGPHVGMRVPGFGLSIGAW
jgi:hypothetical protein